MANVEGLSSEFNPTKEQRELVVKLKAFNTKNEFIRHLIINPDSKERRPIAMDTFLKVFDYELTNAKLKEYTQAISVIKNGMYSENEEHALKCALKVQQLCSKGLLEPKADIKPTDTLAEKIDKIVEGIQTGNLNTFEADSMSKAIELKAKLGIDDLQKEVNEIKAKMGMGK